MKQQVSIVEIETAINYWRARSPSRGEELRLCPEASALASAYAQMIVQGQVSIAVDAIPADARSALMEAFAHSTAS